MIRGFLFAVLMIFECSVANAQQATSVIEENPVFVKVEPMDLPQSQEIPFLKWSSDHYEVKFDSDTVEVSASFSKKVKFFSFNGVEMKLTEDQSFTVSVPYAGNKSRMQIEVADESGKMYRSQYRLAVEKNRTLVITQINGVEEKNLEFSKFRYSLGAGLTLISYRQQDTATFEEKVLTVKGGVVYRAIESVLDLGLSSFYNAAILDNNSPNGDRVKYFGTNLRATYHVIDEPSRIRFNVSGGLYWNSSSGNVGFANMFGPQIYPDVTFLMGKGRSLYFYSKLAVSALNWRGLSLKDNREVAAGVHYSFPVTDLNRLSMGLDLSQLSLSIPDAWASTNTYSFSLGLSF